MKSYAAEVVRNISYVRNFVDRRKKRRKEKTNLKITIWYGEVSLDSMKLESARKLEEFNTPGDSKFCWTEDELGNRVQYVTELLLEREIENIAVCVCKRQD